MKIMLYYVVTRNGDFVCGPFRDKDHAHRIAEDYSNTLWGVCHVEEREREIDR